MYELVLKWINDNDRLPSTGSENSIEKQYAIWCNVRRSDKKNNKLSKERIRKIETTIKNWYWGSEKKKFESFDEMFTQLDEWTKNNNRLPSGTKTEIEKKLSIFCSRKRNVQKKGKLTQVRINILETIKGWYWLQEPRKEVKTYSESYDLLVKWCNDNNKLPSSSSDNEVEKYLAVWCVNKRQAKNKDKLTDEVIKQLEKITGWYWT
jgi:hypothetical protein